jgi:hypothetical protein
MHAVFESGNKIVIDESTSGWHGKDEKRADGPPALTHMIGKPESASFMSKKCRMCRFWNHFSIELQEGKEKMAKRDYSRDIREFLLHTFAACSLQIQAGENLKLCTWVMALIVFSPMHGTNRDGRMANHRKRQLNC